MKVRDQTLEEILDNLEPLDSDWMDETAEAAVRVIESFPQKASYDRDDVLRLFQEDFDLGKLVARLFLGLSKDGFDARLAQALGGSGVTTFRKDRDRFVDVLMDMGLPDAMAECVNREVHWYDVLIERLRSGRGSAISGQRRGRALEDVVEQAVRQVFGEDRYRARCSFEGARGRKAKCDFAIPSGKAPRIIIEVKGYAATGSKMTDVIGDLDAIIAAKRHDTRLLFFTDGEMWRMRTSDLKKIVERQNAGEIARIYTKRMLREFIDDLEDLKKEL